MKNKTTTAVLLSLMAVAGLAVTDAYAQSNTERLESIDDATQDILEDTEGVPGALESLSEAVSAIQASLSDMATSLASLMSAITGVQDAVNGVSSTVTDMSTSVYNTESSVNRVETAVGGVSTEVGAISSKIMDMDAMLQSVAGLDARLAGIEGSIMSLESAMQSMDGDSDADTLAALAQTTLSNNAQLAEVLQRLAIIEAGLELLGADVKGIATAPSQPGNVLLEGETELNINSYDYKNYGDANTDSTGRYYELELTFSCSDDIFLDRVYLIHDGDTAAAITATPASTYERYFGLTKEQDGVNTNQRHTTHNFVTVDGRDLFDTHFRFSSTTDTAAGQTYDLPAAFDNEPLKAGDTLRFESQVYERTTGIVYDKNGVSKDPLPNNVAIKMIDGANRTYSLPFFEVNVEWLTYNSGTTCSIGFGTGGAVSPGLTKTKSLVYGVSTDPAHSDRSLKDFSNTIDCGGEPVEITEITVDTSGDWKLAGFVNVKLEYGSNEHTLEFDRDAKDAMITNGDDFLPIYLGNDELTISGSIPLKDLLVELTYKSQPDTDDCTAPSDY